MTRPIATGHIRRYLLGELSGDEEAQFEAAYFADPALLARVEAEDHDLTDEYVSGQLTRAERERFEARHRTPEHLEEIALARALRANAAGRATASAVSFRITPLAWAAAAALLVLALFLWWPRTPETRPVADAQRPPAPSIDRPAPNRPAPDTNRPSSTSAPNVTAPPADGQREARVATLLLTSDLTRDAGDPPTVQRAPGITHVALTLPRGERVRDRQPVRLESAEGRVLWTGLVDRSPGGSSAAQDATVRIPVSALPVGDYVLTIVDGTTAQSSFFFRVR